MKITIKVMRSFPICKPVLSYFHRHDCEGMEHTELAQKMMSDGLHDNVIYGITHILNNEMLIKFNHYCASIALELYQRMRPGNRLPMEAEDMIRKKMVIARLPGINDIPTASYLEGIGDAVAIASPKIDGAVFVAYMNYAASMILRGDKMQAASHSYDAAISAGFSYAYNSVAIDARTIPNYAYSIKAGSIDWHKKYKVDFQCKIIEYGLGLITKMEEAHNE